MKEQQTIKIIIADAAFIIRKGLKAIIEDNGNLKLVAETTRINTLQHELNTFRPQVLIIDHDHPGFSTNDIVSIKQNHPWLNIMVISQNRPMNEIKKILGAGIKNYLLKDCSESEIVDAINACAKNERYLCKQIIDVLVEREILRDTSTTGSISSRELEVIHHLVSGLKPKEIAAHLQLSYHTVIAHKRNIYSKLGISSAMELAKYVVNADLLT